MKTLGNIIWVVFGGLHIALEYFIAGLMPLKPSSDNTPSEPLKVQ